MKVALITGITGQDGSYLAELLLEKGYEVHGIVRRASLINTHRIDHIYDDIHLHYGDLTDATNIIGVIKKVEPDEIYNLGAQSHVKVSFETPEYTGNVDGLGTLRILRSSSSSWYGRSRFVSIKHQHQNYMVWFKKFLKEKLLRSIHARLTVWLNSTDTGSSKTIESPMDYTQVLELLFNHESPRRGRDVCYQKNYPRIVPYFNWGTKRIISRKP